MAIDLLTWISHWEFITVMSLSSLCWWLTISLVFFVFLNFFPILTDFGLHLSFFLHMSEKVNPAFFQRLIPFSIYTFPDFSLASLHLPISSVSTETWRGHGLAIKNLSSSFGFYSWLPVLNHGSVRLNASCTLSHWTHITTCRIILILRMKKQD